MKIILIAIAAIVFSISVGALVSRFNNYSGVAYVVFLMLDFVAFSFFCIKKHIILIKPYSLFLAVNLVVGFYFLTRT